MMLAGTTLFMNSNVTKSVCEGDEVKKSEPLLSGDPAWARDNSSMCYSFDKFIYILLSEISNCCVAKNSK